MEQEQLNGEFMLQDFNILFLEYEHKSIIEEGFLETPVLH